MEILGAGHGNNRSCTVKNKIAFYDKSTFQIMFVVVDSPINKLKDFHLKKTTQLTPPSTAPQ